MWCLTLLGIIIDKLFLDRTNQKIKDKVIEAAFFAFNGVLVGVLSNDIIRILVSDVPEKPLIQYGMAAVMGLSGFYGPFRIFGNMYNNYSMAMGMTLGTVWSNITEKGGQIHLLDTKPEEKVRFTGW